MLCQSAWLSKNVVEQRRHFRLLDQPAAAVLGDVAGEAKRRECQAEAAFFEKARKRPDEFEHDVVDVKDQQRPVVGAPVRRSGAPFPDRRSCQRLASRAFTSTLRSCRRLAAARAVRQGPRRAGCRRLRRTAASVGSCATMNCSTPARKPGSLAARRIAEASIPVIARKRGSSSGSDGDETERGNRDRFGVAHALSFPLPSARFPVPFENLTSHYPLRLRPTSRLLRHCGLKTKVYPEMAWLDFHTFRQSSMPYALRRDLRFGAGVRGAADRTPCRSGTGTDA